MLVVGKTIGKKRPLFDDWSVPPPDDLGGGGETTLRDLIEHLVRQEVRAFQTRQQRNQFIKTLTQKEIKTAEQAGKIAMGGSEIPIQEVDVDQAIHSALTAFEDGLFLSVIDGTNIKRLEQQIYIHEDSQITFIRLAMLTGG